MDIIPIIPEVYFVMYCQDAWQEIAAYEGGNKEEVRRRSLQMSALQNELQELRSSSITTQEYVVFLFLIISDF